MSAKKQSIFRCLHDACNPFISISRKTFLNSELTSTETVLLVFLLSYKDDWNFYKQNIKRHFLKRFPDVSDRAFEQAFTGLKKKNFLTLNRQSVKGFNYDWQIFESSGLELQKSASQGEAGLPALCSFAGMLNLNTKQKYINNKNNNNKYIHGIDNAQIEPKPVTVCKNINSVVANVDLKPREETVVANSHDARIKQDGSRLLQEYRAEYEKLKAQGIAAPKASRQAREKFAEQERNIIDVMNSAKYVAPVVTLEPISAAKSNSATQQTNLAPILKQAYCDTSQVINFSEEKLKQKIKCLIDTDNICIDKSTERVMAEVLYHAKSFVPIKPHQPQERFNLNINIALLMLKKSAWQTPFGFQERYGAV